MEMGNTFMYKAQLNNIPLSTLDIIKTFECGQCFRWKLVGHQPGEYVEYSGIVGNHYYKVRQTYINNNYLQYLSTLHTHQPDAQPTST